MAPRYRRRRYLLSRSSKTRYSNVTYAAISQFVNNQENQYVIQFTGATSVLGTRKCKNFTLSLCSNSIVPFNFALVFVPEGTSPSQLHAGVSVSEGVLLAASLYEPNQNVILSGSFGGPNSTVEKFKTRLARNLNSGDRIVLIVKPLQYDPDSTDQVLVNAMVNYAISY